MSAKRSYVSAKETCMSAKEPDVSAKETCICAKERELKVGGKGGLYVRKKGPIQ